MADGNEIRPSRLSIQDLPPIHNGATTDRLALSQCSEKCVDSVAKPRILRRSKFVPLPQNWDSLNTTVGGGIGGRASLKKIVQVCRYRNGKVSQRVTLLNGLRHGVAKTWHRNGTIASHEPYFQGQLHGVCRQWNEAGELLGEYAMEHGTGIQREWYDNGQIKIEVSTVAGEFCGRNRMWLRDGALISEEFYLRGMRVSRQQYARAVAQDATLPALPAVSRSKPLRPSRALQRRSHQTFISGLLERVNQSEARSWLSGRKPSAAFPSLGRFRSIQVAITFVNALYDAGAREMIVPDIYRDRKGREFADCLLVRLPRTAAIRKRIRKVCGLLRTKALGAFQPERDIGETHLYLVLE